MGEYRPEMIPDDWVWSEYWTRYFTDVEPTSTWVVECDCAGGRRVAGYLTGTSDARRFDAYVARLMPGIAWHVIRRRLMRRAQSRRAIWSLLRSMFDGAAADAGLVAAHPATCHVDLLPEARGRGTGFWLLRRFIKQMRQRGVSGVHAQTLSINGAINKLLPVLGLRVATRRRVHAFAHLDSRPIEVLTWALRL